MKVFTVPLITIVLAGALLAGPALAKDKVRVLFIGNSLTAVNDLPALIGALAEDRQQEVDWDMYVPGGYRFSQHAASPDALNKIKAGRWDFVVLQEQSQLPAFPAAQVESYVYPFAQKLCTEVRRASPRAKIVFYETMGWRDGDAKNAAVFPEVATYAGMQRRLNESYRHMAKANRALLAPVGEVWAAVRADRPSLDLYADDTHPNLAGSYLAACVLYKVFFRQSPLGLPHPPQIDNETAVYLQKRVAKLVK